MAATSGMGGGMQGRFLGNSGELNPEIWDAANVRFCLGGNRCAAKTGGVGHQNLAQLPKHGVKNTDRQVS